MFNKVVLGLGALMLSTTSVFANVDKYFDNNAEWAYLGEMCVSERQDRDYFDEFPTTVYNDDVIYDYNRELVRVGTYEVEKIKDLPVGHLGDFGNNVYTAYKETVYYDQREMDDGTTERGAHILVFIVDKVFYTRVIYKETIVSDLFDSNGELIDRRIIEDGKVNDFGLDHIQYMCNTGREMTAKDMELAVLLMRMQNGL